MKLASYRLRALLSQLVEPGEFKAIRFINYHKYAPGEVHEAHSHQDREEVFICISGRGHLTGASEMNLSGGDVVVISPGDTHGFISDSENPLEYVCIACNLPD